MSHLLKMMVEFEKNIQLLRVVLVHTVSIHSFLIASGSSHGARSTHST
jgi:hypothetical protein